MFFEQLLSIILMGMKTSLNILSISGDFNQAYATNDCYFIQKQTK
jgi:Holliday junction resolvasome RuvABC DNA-binding subunit